MPTKTKTKTKSEHGSKAVDAPWLVVVDPATDRPMLYRVWWVGDHFPESVKKAVDESPRVFYTRRGEVLRVVKG